MTRSSDFVECCPPLDGLLQPALFKALSDPNRLAILCRLAECGTASRVSEVAACCPVDLSVVSRHLGVLRRAGVLAAERRGKEVHYSVRMGWLIRTLRELADALEACCPPASEPADTPPADAEREEEDE